MMRCCLAVLKAAHAPMSMREIVTALIANKGGNPDDPAYAQAVRHRATIALTTLNHRGTTRLAGAQSSKRVRWILDSRDSQMFPESRKPCSSED